MKKHYQTGLIVGRFQPFHKGHLYLFRKTFEQIDQVVIVIGSINRQDQDNPFAYSKIEKNIKLVLKHEGWEERVSRILGVPDFARDDDWLTHIKKTAGSFAVVASHNDWVSSIFRRAGYPVLEIPFFHREIYEGVKIRKLMRQKKNWQMRMPEYLRDQY